MSHPARRAIARRAMQLAALSVAAYGTACGVARWFAPNTTMRETPASQVNAAVESANTLLPVAPVNGSLRIVGTQFEPFPPNPSTALPARTEPDVSPGKSISAPGFIAQAATPPDSGAVTVRQAQLQIPPQRPPRPKPARGAGSTIDGIGKADPLKFLLIETELQYPAQGAAMAVAGPSASGEANRSQRAPGEK